jgi:predicted permease
LAAADQSDVLASLALDFCLPALLFAATAKMTPLSLRTGGSLPGLLLACSAST